MRDRRPVAVALFLIIGVIPGALAAFELQSIPVGIPASFQVAPPLDGDRGTYNLTIFRDTPRGPAILNATGEAFTFERRFHVLPVNGTWQIADELRVYDGDYGCTCGGDDRIPGYTSSVLAPGLLANGRGFSQVEHSPIRHSETIDLTRSGAYEGGTCGLRNQMQLGAVLLPFRGPRDEPPFWCTFESGGAMGLAHFRAIGMAPYGEESALVVEATYQANDGPTRLQQFWFVPSIPYPVRSTYRLGDASGDYGSFELVDFSRGKPLPIAPSKVPVAIGMAPGDWMGPTWSRPHPFSLQTALTAALEHPIYDELRDFMAEHPQAFVQSAQLRERQDQSFHEYGWHIGISDGAAAFGVTITLDRRDPVAANRPGDLIGPAGIHHESITFDKNNGAANRQFCFPNEAPAVWPRLEDMADLYVQVHEVAPSGWGFDLPGNGCLREGMATSWVGQDVDMSDTRWGDPLRRPTPHSAMFPDWIGSFSVQDRMSFDLKGQLVRVEHALDARGSLAAPQEPPRTWDSFEPQAIRTSQDLVFRPTVAAAMSALIAGGLAALGYWLWPMMKHAMLSMFTRRVDEAASQSTRQRIIAKIQNEPGIHMQGLARAVETGLGNLRHHLEVLERSGRIERRREGGYVRIYPIGDHRRGLPIAKGAQAVLEAVGQGIRTASAIADATGLARGTVHYHLRRLETDGWVAGGPNGFTAR